MCQISCQLDIIDYSIHKLIFLCIIWDYKNMKFKHLIDDIVIDLWLSRNFASMNDIGKKCNSNNGGFIKIHIHKKNIDSNFVKILSSFPKHLFLFLNTLIVVSLLSLVSLSHYCWSHASLGMTKYNEPTPPQHQGRP